MHKMTKEGRLDYFIGALAAVQMVSMMNINEFVSFSFDGFKPTELKIVCSKSDKNRAFIQAFEQHREQWFQEPNLPLLWHALHKNSVSISFSEFVKQQLHKKTKNVP
mgnify:CR=1 FL=1